MYKWEEELKFVVDLFGHQVRSYPDTLRIHIQEAVTSSANLMQKSIAEEFSEARKLESIEFLKKSVVTINSLIPSKTLERLAVKIISDLPRPHIEIRLINSKYTSDGHLAVIEDHCPEEEAGECLATIYLVRLSSLDELDGPPSTTIH